MPSPIRNKKFEDLKVFADIIMSADNHQECLQRLNGLRAGYSRGKTSLMRVKRIIVLEELVRLYK